MATARALAAAALLALACAQTMSGAESPAELGPKLPLPLPAGFSAVPPNDATESPGREAPAAAPREGVVRVAWHDYHTLIVIGPGAGTARPAWILTYQGEDGDDLAVAYRAVAYRDRHGVLHADARNALIVGPQAANWSPDSFMVAAPGTVSTLDDRDDAENGQVTGVVQPDQREYQFLLVLAQALVGESS
jgi:hypothetical protein